MGGRARYELRKVRVSLTFFNCKLNALFKLLFVFQAHFPVRLPCYDLPHLVLCGFIVLESVVIEEGDGRCVRAPGLFLKKHSCLFYC